MPEANLTGNGTIAESRTSGWEVRAGETAKLLGAALAPGMVPETMTGLNPNDAIEPVARRIAEWTSDVMLVGHLPFMGKLVAHLLAGDQREPVVAFVPGTVVCLERGEAGHWAIMWMVRRKLAPGTGASCGS